MPLSPRPSLTLVDLVEARLSSRLDQIGAGIANPITLYGVLDVTPDLQAGLHPPCIVVMILRDAVGPNLVPDADLGGVTQRVTTTFSVTHGVQSFNSPGDRKGIAEDWVTRLVERTRDALLAWAPAPAEAPADEKRFPGNRWAPLELRAGQLAALDAHGRAWWEDRYETHRLVRGEPLPADPPGAVPSTVYSGLHDAGASPRDRHVRLTGDVAC